MNIRFGRILFFRSLSSKRVCFPFNSIQKQLNQKEVSLKYNLCWLIYCLDLNFLVGIAAEQPKLTKMPDNNAGCFLPRILAYIGCLEKKQFMKVSIFE